MPETLLFSLILIQPREMKARPSDTLTLTRRPPEQKNEGVNATLGVKISTLLVPASTNASFVVMTLQLTMGNRCRFILPYRFLCEL